MPVSRCAQTLVASVLAVGLAVGPASGVSAAPTVEEADSTEADAEESAESQPSEEGSDAPEAAEGSEAPEAAEGSDAPEAAGGEPSEGVQPEAAEPEPEVAPSEPEPSEPEVSVRTRAVSSDRAGKPVPEGQPPREVEADPRRLRSDENILLKASAVSFGVAGLAAVPLVIGLQQSAKARGQLDDSSLSIDEATRAELEDDEQRMNRLALVGGIVAGVQLVTGAVLLGVGLRRPRSRRHALAPTAGPGGLGLVWTGRF